MAQWMGRLGFELEPLSEHVLLRIKQGPRVFAEETELPTLEPAARLSAPLNTDSVSPLSNTPWP